MRPTLAGPHIPPARLLLTYGIVGGLTALFVLRLYQLQVLQGREFTALAEENRLTEVNVAAPRGVIYDRNGYQLVRNIPAFNVVVTPAFLPDSPAEVEAIYQVISDLTGVPVDQGGPPAARCIAGRGIRQLVEEGATIRPYEAWPVACDVPERVARILREREMDLPGVTVEAVPVRDYTTGDLTAAVIGYLGPIPEAFAEAFEALDFVTGRDKIGYTGIEGQYQTELAGQNGVKLVVEDVAHQHLFEVGEVRQPIPGNSLRLTLDTRLQSAAATALANRIEFLNRFAGEVRAPMGVVIAMNPQTGEILAMVTLPTYENNRMARFIPADYYNQLIADERGKPLINHAVSGEFPPGSTFKMATAIGILNEGVVTPQETIFDPGIITIANRYYP
ncbi:MAG: penicillin-binding transpeptidase domain-containing protein, partial [Anaerolineales bacterium]